MTTLRLNKTSTRYNRICAYAYISESELVVGYPDYDASWETERPEEFKKILWRLGLDVNKPYERQDGLQHRNRLNQVVVCSRWVGEERLDKGWIRSEYASQEARDKVTGSKMLEDSYRRKKMTEDIQEEIASREHLREASEELEEALTQEDNT